MGQLTGMAFNTILRFEF